MLRLQGLLLFLCIPLVLYLLLCEPVQPLAALLVGLAIMFAHRFVARPFMVANLDKRCIWSGAEVAPGCGYKVTSGGETYTFNSYSDGARDQAARFFTFAQKFAWPLRIAILGPLAFYVVVELLRLSGHEVVSHATAAMVFRGIIGLTTLTTFVAYRFVEPIPHMKGPVAFPFPVHNVSLLGIRFTLWIFAAVGAWWVVQTIRALVA